MTKALLRAGLPTRAMLVFASAFCCGLIRLMSAVAGDAAEWAASPMRELATVVALGLIVPTFVILLGGMLLRGEHAPWSWSLARPVARARMLATLVGLDAITIALCTGIAALIFAGFDDTLWRRVDTVDRVAGAILACGVLYAATAVGSARGMTALRSGAFALAWLGALGFLATKLAAPSFFRAEHHFARYRNRFWADWPARDIAAEIGIVLGVEMVAIAVVLAFYRAATSVPATPAWRTLLRPSLGAFVACFGVSFAVHCLVHFIDW